MITVSAGFKWDIVGAAMEVHVCDAAGWSTEALLVRYQC